MVLKKGAFFILGIEGYCCITAWRLTMLTPYNVYKLADFVIEGLLTLKHNFTGVSIVGRDEVMGLNLFLNYKKALFFSGAKGWCLLGNQIENLHLLVNH